MPSRTVLTWMNLAVAIAVPTAAAQTISFFREFNTPRIDRGSAAAANASGIYVAGASV